MSDLKNKAISIKGKEYILVSDRVVYFNDKFKNGAIITELVSEPSSERVIVKATVIPDAAYNERRFTGYSQAVIGEGYINRTAALENAETSAVGRALGLMGIGVIDGIASVDEINKSGIDSNRAKNAPNIASNYVYMLKNRVAKLGAKSIDEAKQIINRNTGVTISNFDELTQEQARSILESFDV